MPRGTLIQHMESCNVLSVNLDTCHGLVVWRLQVLYQGFAMELSFVDAYLKIVPQKQFH